MTFNALWNSSWMVWNLKNTKTLWAWFKSQFILYDPQENTILGLSSYINLGKMFTHLYLFQNNLNFIKKIIKFWTMLSYNTYFHKLGTIFSNNLNIKGTTSQLDSLSQLEHIEFMHIQLVTIPRASPILNLIKNTKMNLLGTYLLSLLLKISIILFFQLLEVRNSIYIV
jgi:hypothetical protein